MDFNTTFKFDECVPLFGSNRKCTYRLNFDESLYIFTRDKEGKIIDKDEDKSNSLYIDDIWPGSIVISDFLINFSFLCSNKYVLELGAGLFK